jgi:hypothetical protein
MTDDNNIPDPEFFAELEAIDKMLHDAAEDEISVQLIGPNFHLDGYLEGIALVRTRMKMFPNVGAFLAHVDGMSDHARRMMLAFCLERLTRPKEHPEVDIVLAPIRETAAYLYAQIEGSREKLATCYDDQWEKLDALITMYGSKSGIKEETGELVRFIDMDFSDEFDISDDVVRVFNRLASGLIDNHPEIFDDEEDEEK